MPLWNRLCVWKSPGGRPPRGGDAAGDRAGGAMGWLSWIALGLILVAPVGFTASCAGSSGIDAGVDADDGDAGGDPGPKPCASHAACPSGMICMAGYCTDGTPCSKPSDCPAGTVCNIMRDVCEPEPCASDNDCKTKPLTPHCLVSSQLCVACTENAHCGADMTCDLASYTCKPIGPACTTDADCTEPTKRHCHDGKCYGCWDDSHCPGGACHPINKICVQCVQDIQCFSPTPKCNTTTNTCVQCLSDNDCSGGLHCNTSTGSCTSVTCQSANDCQNEPGRPFCNTATGDCVQCLQSSDCGQYAWCRNFSCQAGCQTDPECVEKNGADYHCDGNGSCFYAECVSDNDCADTPQTPHCKLASSPANPPKYTCVACTQNSHCPADMVCDPLTFVCKNKPCYEYTTNPTPNQKCQEINACYFCDSGTGLCKPMATFTGCYDDQSQPCRCTYNPSDPYSRGGCCPGYHCTSQEKCERNLDCRTNDDCPIDSTCNMTYHQCEHVSCCNPACTSGTVCNESTCRCVSSCSQAGGSCDPSHPCCPGLFCWVFMCITQ